MMPLQEKLLVQNLMGSTSLLLILLTSFFGNFYKRTYFVLFTIRKIFFFYLVFYFVWTTISIWRLYFNIYEICAYGVNYIVNNSRVGCVVLPEIETILTCFFFERICIRVQNHSSWKCLHFDIEICEHTSAREYNHTCKAEFWISPFCRYKCQFRVNITFTLLKTILFDDTFIHQFFF